MEERKEKREKGKGKREEKLSAVELRPKCDFLN